MLLFFIERDELNIYDIPIASIAEEFLEYMHKMETLDIEVASEFILVAATLMRIKAKMLLPRKEVDEQGNEIDPREELVERLLEYKRYKEVTDTLRKMEEDRYLRSKRGNTNTDIHKISELYTTEAELENLDLYKLMKAFGRVIEKMNERENRPVHTVVEYAYSISGQKDFLIAIVFHQSKVNFEDVFLQLENKVHAVFTFLAMLELIQESAIKINIGFGTNNFWLMKGEKD